MSDQTPAITNQPTTSREKLRGQMVEYRHQIEEAERSLLGIRARIKTLKAEQASIHAAPVSKEDFLQSLVAVVDQLGKRGRDNMRGMLTRHLTGDMSSSGGKRFLARDFSLSSIRSIAAGEAQFSNLAITHFLTAAEHTPYEFDFADNFSEVTLCALFGGQIKDAITAVFDDMEWPYPDAQPIEQRLKRLDAIAAELSALEAEATELSGLINGE